MHEMVCVVDGSLVMCEGTCEEGKQPAGQLCYLDTRELAGTETEIGCGSWFGEAIACSIATSFVHRQCLPRWNPSWQSCRRKTTIA